MGPRRALIIASCSKYAAILLQLVATFIVARNVTPDQFGITVLGGGVLLIAEAVRELGSSGYLVQQSVLTQAEVRSAFTISLIVTMTATFFILTTANWIAHFYRDDRLTDYLRVMAIGYALGPFVHPISALLSRDMAFSRIAVIEIVSAGTNAATAILLVKSGFSFMAPAWASVASGTAGMLLGFCFQGDLGIFRPSVSAWKKVLIFGIHGSATAIIYRLGEAVLFLILGRVMDARAVGLLQRAYLIAMIPERVLLAGVSAVAMPAFAEIARNKQPFKPAYLHSVELVTAIYLPGMLCLVLLAKPIVEILLGSSWTQAVPLVQIISTALLLGFPGVLNLSCSSRPGESVKRRHWH
jgi:O-antigen/teichoic acid export membrane protein